MKTMILFRGIPGSGKTTLARELGLETFSADDFFTCKKTGQYTFNPALLSDAHAECQNLTREAMAKGTPIFGVANTFTQQWEIEPYQALAKTFGYRVHTVIVENRHGSTNTHGVPENALQAMTDRFETCL